MYSKSLAGWIGDLLTHEVNPQRHPAQRELTMLPQITALKEVGGVIDIYCAHEKERLVLLATPSRGERAICVHMPQLE